MEVALSLYHLSIQCLCVLEILKHCIINTIKALCNISQQADFLWGGVINPLPKPPHYRIIISYSIYSKVQILHSHMLCFPQLYALFVQSQMNVHLVYDKS